MRSTTIPSFFFLSASALLFLVLALAANAFPSSSSHVDAARINIVGGDNIHAIGEADVHKNPHGHGHGPTGAGGHGHGKPSQQQVQQQDPQPDSQGLDENNGDDDGQIVKEGGLDEQDEDTLIVNTPSSASVGSVPSSKTSS